MRTVINKTRQQIDKKNKFANLKTVFLNFENDCFQMQENHQQPYQLRTQVHFFLHEKAQISVIIKENSYDKKEKAETTV